MKIKTKLGLGIGFLFILIVILILLGIIFTNQIAGNTRNILAQNNKSIEYARRMLLAADNLSVSDSAMHEFGNYLLLQQSNITEAGEGILTSRISMNFEKLRTGTGNPADLRNIRNDLYDLMALNMGAIENKSEIAISKAKTAILIISITGTICFIIAFTLLVNLPGSIMEPINELTGSIKEIAAKNYSHRVTFERKDELGVLARSFNVMAEKLEEYNNSNLAILMMEKKRIDTLINNMHEPVFGLDENGKIIFMNNEAFKVSGLRKEDAIGRPSQEIAVNNDLIRSLIRELVKPGNNAISNEPLKIYTDDKESYFEKEIITITITPTAESNSRYIGDVIILKNITSFKELDSAKTNFIATVSHELKTPLSSILMSLELLEHERIGILNPEQQQLIESVKDDGKRLLRITGELLNLTQVETGKIQLNIQPSQPGEIVRYAVETIKKQADVENIAIETRCDENAGPVYADLDKTSWVLTNLLSNAVRYSYPNSKVILSVKPVKAKMHFSVQDFGQGIDPRYREQIFNRYFRIPGSDKKGTGLGLAISKEFIEAQGGEIYYESEPGKGSIFSFTLPLV
ncbi:MAG TPA: ATP-binding protein [Lentimicrobium sp.]|nr:ATP-binding protein [Bacteroidales bacterium]HLO91183.1 ATP-binding protein [Lentimicrobium sp.]